MKSELDQRTPVTVLTGYLGSGKTTLLNRILTENHGKRIAVIENEFGEVGVDQELVIGADEEIFEMNNGCICCSVRGDLVRILGDFMKRKEKFDAVVIETTGLADPGPVVQTFFADEEMKSKFRLDSIVTLVDAKHIWEHIDDSSEAKVQVAFADVILLNKTDLVTKKDLQRLMGKIRGINTMAKMYSTEKANISMEKVLNVGSFDLDRLLEVDFKSLASDGGHEHDEEVVSVGIDIPGDLDPYKVDRWLGKLLRSRGKDIFRVKGVLSIKDEKCRFVFQAVHMLFDGQPDKPWGDSPRNNLLVFIGRKLNRSELIQSFRDCLV